MVLAMRITPFLLVMAAAAPATAAERRYSLTDFDRIRVEGPYEVRIVSGGPSGATATGDASGLDHVSVDVEGRTLRIRPNRNAWGASKNSVPGPVRVDVTTRSVRSATVIGSGRLAIDRASGLRVDLAVSGSGSLSVAAADADRLEVGLLGAGTIALAGKAKTFRATLQGSGGLDAAALQAPDVELSLDTSGSVAVGAERTAKVRALGTGDTQILGTATCTVTGTAAAYVKCGR
jgi:hypothetical protein